MRLIAVLLAAAVVAPAAPRPLSGGLPASGLQSTLKPTAGLKGLPASKTAGDAAPVCRATCAKDRAGCGATDDDQCAERWVQCVSACGRVD